MSIIRKKTRILSLLLLLSLFFGSFGPVPARASAANPQKYYLSLLSESVAIDPAGGNVVTWAKMTGKKLKLKGSITLYKDADCQEPLKTVRSISIPISKKAKFYEIADTMQRMSKKAYKSRINTNKNIGIAAYYKVKNGKLVYGDFSA